MRIVNETKYRTEDIKRFLVLAHEAMGAPRDKKVRIVYSHCSQHWGCASYGGRWMKLTLPGDPAKVNGLEFARVIEHEIAHNLGIRHPEMDTLTRYCKQSVPWAEGLALRVKEETPRASVDHVARREAHARRMQERWQRRLDAAKRHHQKWTRKVRYYDRKTAARN